MSEATATIPPPKPKPGRKPKKPRAPRQVKPRAYSVCRMKIVPGENGRSGMLLEDLKDTQPFPSQKDAKDWIKRNAKDGEEYICFVVLFLAKAVQKTAIEIE